MWKLDKIESWNRNFSRTWIDRKKIVLASGGWIDSSEYFIASCASILKLVLTDK